MAGCVRRLRLVSKHRMQCHPRELHFPWQFPCPTTGGEGQRACDEPSQRRQSTFIDIHAHLFGIASSSCRPLPANYQVLHYEHSISAFRVWPRARPMFSALVGCNDTFTLTVSRFSFPAPAAEIPIHLSFASQPVCPNERIMCTAIRVLAAFWRRNFFGCRLGCALGLGFASAPGDVASQMRGLRK